MGQFGRDVQRLVVLAAVLLGPGADPPASAGETERVLIPSRESGAASRPEPRAPRLRLVWIDVLDSAPYAFKGAAREASAILADAGVVATWTLGDSSTMTTADELKVVLMAGVANGARLPEHVMGGTRGGSQSHTTWIYLSNVLWALGLKPEPTRRLSRQEEEQVARALGRVVAHEVVHAVVPDLVHSPGGLMAEKLGREFLIQARAFLGPAEQKALRVGLERFAAAAVPAPAVALAAAGR